MIIPTREIIAVLRTVVLILVEQTNIVGGVEFVHPYHAVRRAL